MNFHKSQGDIPPTRESCLNSASGVSGRGSSRRLAAIQQVRTGENGNDFVSATLNRNAPAFLPIYQRQNESHFAAFALNRIDCLDCRPAGRDYVFDDYDRAARPKVPFD
jgi:hypothetical protein